MTSQGFGAKYDSLAQVYSGHELRKKVDSLLLLCDEKNELEQKDYIAFKFSVLNAIDGNIKLAIDYGLISFETNNETDPGGLFQSDAAHHLGRLYRDDKQFYESIKYFSKVIEYGVDSIRVPGAHAEIGRCYSYLGDYYKSIDFYQKGIGLLLKQRQYPNVVAYSSNLAWTYEKINNAESLAIREKVLLKADSLVEALELKPGTDIYVSSFVYFKNTIANQYQLADYYDFNRARSIYLENLKLGALLEDTTILSMTYNNLANLYNIEKSDSASYWAQKGLEVVKYQEDHARLYDNLSDFHLLREEFTKALDYIHKAIELIIESEISLDQAPSVTQLNSCIYKDYLMYCLKRKSEILNVLYERSSEESHLHNIIAQVKAGDELSKLIAGNTQNSDTKFYWRKEASSLYHMGAGAAKELGDGPTAFYFTEKNKAILLAEEIAENTLSAILPNHIPQRDEMLKSRILSLEANNEESDALFNAKKEYNLLKDSIKLLYPEYVARQTGIKIQNLEEVQQSLKKGQLLVSYIWNRPDYSQEKIIALAIDKNKVETFEIIADDRWNDQVAQYRDLVSRPLLTQEDLKTFKALSKELYQALLPAQAINGSKAPKELLIVPDGALQNLPFEALMVDEEGRYLQQVTDLRYLYSYSFLKYNENRPRAETTGSILAYAPVQFGDENLADLPFSGKEAEAVATALEGDALLNAQASKASFMDQSQNYKVLHLATHADAGQDHWIAFSDGKLNLYELYTYQNNADMVVLSGCNTLLGEIALGEGVLSLARGFFYSGAKTVVASIWNTNDRAMSEIMTSFYNNLSDGQGKSEALNNAKREYLNNHDLSEASPYYWAAPLLIGDPEKLNDPFPNYWFVLVGMGFLVTMFALKRRRDQSQMVA